MNVARSSKSHSTARVLKNSTKINKKPSAVVLWGAAVIRFLRVSVSSVIFFVVVLLLTVHGQVRRRFHLARRVGRSARVHARVLGVRGLDEQDGVAALLDHLFVKWNAYETGIKRCDPAKRCTACAKSHTSTSLCRAAVPTYLKVRRRRDDLALAQPLDRGQRRSGDDGAELGGAALHHVHVVERSERRRQFARVRSCSIQASIKKCSLNRQHFKIT